VELLESSYSNHVDDILTVLALLVRLGLAAHILLKKQDPVVCLSWLLGVALFPYATLICYFGFGINPFEHYAIRKRSSRHLASVKQKRKSREDLAKMNRELTAQHSYFGFDHTAMWVSMLQGQPMQGGNSVQMLVNSTNAFRSINDCVDSATTYILVQFYQIQADSIGLGFLDRLAVKASTGVQVHVLFDALGSRGITNALLDHYRRQGVKIHRFLEVHPIKRRFQINWRNHRKLVIVDGVHAYTGGFNMGQLYLEGPDPKRPKWLDIIFKITGPAIADLTAIFAEDWHFTTDKALSDSFLTGSLPLIDRGHSGAHNPAGGPTRPAENLLQIVASGPSENNAPFYTTLISILHEASARVWIMTPYFVPDKELLHAMRVAVVRGVQVRIIVPKRSNHEITDTCAHSYFPELFQYGVELLRYQYGVCHGKLVLADSDLVLAGSSNLDYRSFYLNFETDILVRDRVLAQNISDLIDQVSEGCLPLTARDAANRPVVRLLFRRIMRLFAPLM
jgi:cardiolipin synthase A/B